MNPLALVSTQNTMSLSTIGEDGFPEASYAPMAFIQGKLYSLLSGLSAHSHNLMRHPQAGLLILSESVRNPFARERMSLRTTATVIDREDPKFDSICQEMHESLGETVSLLVGLPDFQLFEFTPIGGDYIQGFGRAYTLNAAIEIVEHVDPRTSTPTDD